MHPSSNIRGIASDHLAGRKIVLAVTGSIAAVKTVELARELLRHGAEVHAVMSRAAQGIITPASLEFATGRPVVTELTGQVEHVALLGDVPERADLLLIAPATANTVGKIAWGIDDTVVTTCATVALGTGVPIVVAPAMHDAMMHNPKVAENVATLRDELGVTWVEPNVEEKKAKLADPVAITEAVIHRLAQDAGPLRSKRCLVIGGATEERIDPVRVLTNRSSGRSAISLATELHRLGGDVELWFGRGTDALPDWLAEMTTRFASHADLATLVSDHDMSVYDEIWMPAAISDYAPSQAGHKIASGQDDIAIHLTPLSKIAAAIRAAAPDAVLVPFKAESDPDVLIERAMDRMQRYNAQYVVANTADSFGVDATKAHLVAADGRVTVYIGDKRQVLAAIARHVATGGKAPGIEVKP